MLSILSSVHFTFSTFLKYVEIVSLELNIYMLTTAVVAMVLLLSPRIPPLFLHSSFGTFLPVTALAGLGVLGILQAHVLGLGTRPSYYILFIVKAAYILVSVGLLCHLRNLVGVVTRLFTIISIFSAVIWLVDVSPYTFLDQYDLVEPISHESIKHGVGVSRVMSGFVIHLLVAFFIALSVFLSRSRNRWPWGIVSAFLLVVILLARVDAGKLAILAGAYSYVVVRWFPGVASRPWTTAMFILTTIVVGSYTVAILAFTVGDMGNFSLLSRLYLWDIAYQMFLSSPFFGIGMGAFEFSEYVPKLIFDLEQLGSRSAHSDIFELLATGGVIGLSLYLVFCFATLTLAVRNARQSASAFDLGMMSAFVAIFSIGMYGSIYSHSLTLYTISAIIITRTLRRRSLTWGQAAFNSRGGVGAVD